MRPIFYVGIAIVAVIILFSLKGCDSTPAPTIQKDIINYTMVPSAIPKADSCYQIKYEQLGFFLTLDPLTKLYCDASVCCVTSNTGDGLCPLAQCISKKEVDNYNMRKV